MFKKESIVRPVELKSFSKGRLSLIMAVDEFPSQDFNKNEAGWIRNDIAALARAQSQAEIELLLKRLGEVRTSDSNIPKDVPLKDAYNLIRPRYAQTENEFVEFAEAIGAKAQANLDAAYAAIRAKHIAKNSPAPASAPDPAPAAE